MSKRSELENLWRIFNNSEEDIQYTIPKVIFSNKVNFVSKDYSKDPRLPQIKLAVVKLRLYGIDIQGWIHDE